MEEKEKRKGKSPLLYIHQPDFVRPEFSMQYSFSSSPNTTTSPENKSTPTPRKLKNSVPFQVQANSKEHESLIENEYQAEKPKSAVDYFRNQTNSSKKNWNLTPVKAFKEMSISEKLQYLLQVPRSQPPFPCEFIKEDERIRGILESKKGDNIQVKTFNGDVLTIAIEDLQAIRIIF
ncbi:CotO family spore coat protein [Lederbergia galactosidilytica]|uniref:Spore coat protein CotO n=1 Tax=Lederbergia galactosidilytica TaxID=217031 RepID=A0A177ZIE1_9BACI|nr:CotO family spore coat protein [Lederbergia galactosidilytica]KRG15971.1 hypothetical protein ACA30_03600 [Virgibacillus soli]MBP1915650.1 hypothetical protein [Lederbergia galactosidilytica]OAK67716.1 hypothetical protein ABB05_18585 [Lederbergia galactosidilytica]